MHKQSKNSDDENTENDNNEVFSHHVAVYKPKEARDLAQAINHKWAYTFFQCGYMTGDNGKVQHVDKRERTNFIKHLSYKVDKQFWCKEDSAELHDFFVRLHTLVKYMEVYPDNEFYRNHHWFSTARNAFASMLYFATTPCPSVDAKIRQRMLCWRLGGEDRWERIRKAQRIFWPKERSFYLPLMSADSLGLRDLIPFDDRLH